MADESDEAIERKRLQDAVRDAKPAILKDNKPLFGTPPQPRRIEDEVRRTDHPRGSVLIQPQRPPFPPPAATASTTVSTSASVPSISFILSDASEIVSNVLVHKIHVDDGQIDEEFPTGMGSGGITLTPSDANDGVVMAGVQFDPTTLAITDRFVNVYTTATVPESRVEDDATGFLYWKLGYCFIEDDIFNIINTWTGDINFAFTYGELNGKPALLPVHSNPGWIDLDLA